MAKHNAEIVLRALLKGCRVNMLGEQWAVGENGDGKLVFGVIFPEHSETVVDPGLTLNAFVNTCASMTEEEIVSVSFNSVMMEG